MQFSILDYWEILKQYTNPFDIIKGTILYILIFFFVTLVLVFVFRKRILVKRQNAMLKYLSYAYFIVLPLLSGFFGFKYGMANAVEKDLIKHTDSYSTAIENSFLADSSGILKAVLSGDVNMAKNTPGISVNNSIDVLTYVIYDSYGATLEKAAKANNTVTAKVAGLFLKVTQSMVISKMVKKTLHNVISEKVGLGEELSDKLMETKLNELIKNGIFKEIAIIQIKQVFGGIKKGVLIMLSLVFGACIIEIGIAHYYLKKQTAHLPTSDLNS